MVFVIVRILCRVGGGFSYIRAEDRKILAMETLIYANLRQYGCTQASKCSGVRTTGVIEHWTPLSSLRITARLARTIREPRPDPAMIGSH